jgi:hypothetical protein
MDFGIFSFFRDSANSAHLFLVPSRRLMVFSFSRCQVGLTPGHFSLNKGGDANATQCQRYSTDSTEATEPKVASEPQRTNKKTLHHHSF